MDDEKTCRCKQTVRPDKPDKRILVEVSGGNVQDAFVTEDLDLQECRIPNEIRFYLVDWDNIKEGDVTTSPWLEWHLGVITAAEFEAKLAGAEKEHAVRRVCYHCGTPMIVDGKVVHSEDTCPEAVWERDEIQFPRLLLALQSIGDSPMRRALLAKDMDISEEQVDELLTRAAAAVARDQAEAAPEAG